MIDSNDVQVRLARNQLRMMIEQGWLLGIVACIATIQGRWWLVAVWLVGSWITWKLIERWVSKD